MDLNTDAMVTAAAHAADRGAAPRPKAPAELIADKGYHSRDALSSPCQSENS
jgi:hypothetical protein